MSLKIYNTMSKRKEEFIPLKQGLVKMYVCGPTVYDYLHIGNFRGAIFFNTLRKWLEKKGNEVIYVYNYTDVDDKIINKALQEGVSAAEISQRYIKAFEEDYARLGLTPHSHNPKVTEYMDEIIETVKKLIENDMAYVVDGEVFYQIEKFKKYCCLSGKNFEDLNAGQRVEVDQKKRNPADFVLWKPAKSGEPFWDSPWGKGRPGWHIECTAMSQKILGETFDIHGGGIDLIFPHHENEIAQGEGASGKEYCRYWMHNNFINMDGEKMSKSLGNLIPGREFMDEYHPEILKFLFLSAHYRSVLNISDEKINGAMSGLSRFYNALKDANTVLENENVGNKALNQFDKLLKVSGEKINTAFDDDFNTSEVFGVLFDVVREFNKLNILKKMKDANAIYTAKIFKDWLMDYGNVLGLFQYTPAEILADIDEILIRQKNIDRVFVESLLRERTQAREEKNWTRSDEIRDQLNDLGIEIMDSPQGVTWGMKK
ncbi:MAG: cysteine--tRNA ligase [Halobacteriovoraceae bacterium]|nr:cysteine--tRNA ligase [Halobacteriovoraceae bacterium]